MNEPITYWDEEQGIATCIIREGKHQFVGEAKCAEEDKDMKSQITGGQIAYHRALIKYYLYLKNEEILPALKVLKQFYNTINKSKNFNEKSYENKMLRRQIRMRETQLEITNNLLSIEKQELKDYLAAKEKLFKLMRRNRLEDQEVKKHQSN